MNKNRIEISDIFGEKIEQINKINTTGTINQINQIIKKNNLSNNTKIRERIELVIQSEKYLFDRSKDILGYFDVYKESFAINIFQKIRNEKIFEKDCIEFDNFPRENALLSIFILLWKNGPIPSLYLSCFNCQYAKQIENLRRKCNCVFARHRSKNGKLQNYEIIVNGKRCRNLVGFDLGCGFELKDNYIEASDKFRNIFLQNCGCCAISGKKYSPRGNLEIDHRTPIQASIMDGIVPEKMTNETIINKTSHKSYQALEKKYNIEKREKCKKCLDGENIEVPEDQKINQKKGIFLTYRIDTCVGCYWHDPNRSLRNMEDFE